MVEHSPKILASEDKVPHTERDPCGRAEVKRTGRGGKAGERQYCHLQGL